MIKKTRRKENRRILINFVKKVSSFSTAFLLLFSSAFSDIKLTNNLTFRVFDTPEIEWETEVRDSSAVENEEEKVDILGEVQANYPSGALIKGSLIILSCSYVDAEIYYTLDGSPPDKNSTLYKEPLEFDGTALVINARVYKDEQHSATSTFIYTWAQLSSVQANLPSGSKLQRFDQITLSYNGSFDTIKYQITKRVKQPGETILAEAVYRFPLEFEISDFPLQIVAYATKTGYADSEPARFIYTLSENAAMQVYFGQLHSHTKDSDGSGTVEEAFNWAKKVAKLDFFAVTDHSHCFDLAPPTEAFSSLNLITYNANNAIWKNGQAAAAAATDADFIGIYGFEMTYAVGTAGHINTFNTTGFVSKKNTIVGNGRAGLQAYYELLKAAPDSISQFNHPGPRFGDFYSFAYHDPIIDQRISLIEVGNGESFGGPSFYVPAYQAYDLALLRGWHVGPTNNQDNHYRNWGSGNDHRTAVLTDDFSTAGIYAALRKRQVYATEDKNLEIYYFVNDNPMGSILPQAPAWAEFVVDVRDPDVNDEIAQITLIHNGKPLYEEKPGSQNHQMRYRLDKPQAGYYYIKVVQADGDIAVTAPVWLGEANIRFIAADNIALNVTSKTVALGTTFQLKAVLVPTYNTDVVQWLSSNRDVAAVDEAGKLTPLKPGKTTITAHLTSGKKASAIITVSATPPTPSIQVSGNRATERFTSLKLLISAGSNTTNSTPATGYEVYSSTSSTKNFRLIATISDPDSYTVNNGLASNTTYYYKVRAYVTVNGTRYYSAYSAVKSAKTATPNPAKPTLSVTKSSNLFLQYNTVNLNYISAVNADTEAVDGYEVYRSSKKNKAYTLVADVTDPAAFFSNTNLNPGTTYYYKVRAYRLVAGRRYYSSYSAIKSAKTTGAKPNKPSLTVSKIADSLFRHNTLELAYKSAASTGIKPVCGYEIYRSTSKNKGYVLIATVNDPSEFTLNTSLSPSQIYYYKVRAFNIINNKKYYSAFSSVKSNKTFSIITKEHTLD